VVRKKRVIIWAVVLAVVVISAVLYPVISKEMKTPRVTWYLEAPAGTEIRAVSPNGRYFVALGNGRAHIAKEGEAKWTELSADFEPGILMVSDLGTAMFQKSPIQVTWWVGDWYWFRAGEKGVRIDPRTSPFPQEFIEETDNWIGVYGKSQDKLGVFDLSGSLCRPAEPPAEALVASDGRWVDYYIQQGEYRFSNSGSAFNERNPHMSRYFVRIGTTFEERKVPPASGRRTIVSQDGHWVAVSDFEESRVYKDGTLKERLSFQHSPDNTGFRAIGNLFNQYILQQPSATVRYADFITSFDSSSRRRVGYVVTNEESQGYVQDGGDRFYASELGIRPQYDKPDFTSFNYVSLDGRRIIGGDKSRPLGAFVFAIDH